MGSISAISGSLLQTSLFQTNALTGDLNTSTSSSILNGLDNNQLSPLANVLSDLQTLQQTDPARYKDLTGQIAANLRSAANADTSSGNVAGASQLNQIATDFTTASTTGQLPNIQDLASAEKGGHHHHHGHGDRPSESSSSVTDAAGADQLLSAYENSQSQANSVNPLSIILDTLNTSSN